MKMIYILSTYMKCHDETQYYITVIYANILNGLAVVAHAYKPWTGEAEAGRFF